MGKTTIATKLCWVGSADHYVVGVRQGDLRIVANPKDETEVTLERARELVASRLYVAVDGVLPSADEPSDEPTADAGEEVR